MGYCARLKAIGVNLFRASKVKRARGTLSAAPGTLVAAFHSTISVVKERFWNLWLRLGDIFYPATENTLYRLKSAV